MADLSTITLPNNSTYNLRDNGMTYNRLIPLQSKTFTGVVASGNSDPAGWYYFGNIKPVDYDTPWKIRYLIRSTIAGLTSNQCGYFDVQMRGMHNTYYAWDIYNIQHSSYRALYSHLLYPCTSTGVSSGYGHLIGMRLQSSYNPTTAANSRTFAIDIISTENCSFTFYDSFTLYANVSGTGSTNYYTRYSFDGTSSGHKMYGDANDVNYQNRIYYGRFKTITASGRYIIFLQKNDQYLVPVNALDNSTVTTKTLTTQSFDPFGYIFYWGATTNYAVNAQIGDGYLYNQNHSINLGYSFNTGTTLVNRNPIDLVADIQSDGSAKLASNPISTSLPASQDGHIYIFLGKAINTTNIQLYPIHPIYWYKGGKVKFFTKADLNNIGALWQYNSTNDCVELIFPN